MLRVPRTTCSFTTHPSPIQARLELAVARLEGDLAAAARRLELAGADLDTERARLAGARDLLERKARAPLAGFYMGRQPLSRARARA